MNPSHYVADHQPQQPQEYQDRGYHPEHRILLLASPYDMYDTPWASSSLWGVTLPGITAGTERRGIRWWGRFGKPGRFQAIPEGLRARSSRRLFPRP